MVVDVNLQNMDVVETVKMRVLMNYVQVVTDIIFYVLFAIFCDDQNIS
jgi:hypothetical protein